MSEHDIFETQQIYTKEIENIKNQIKAWKKINTNSILYYKLDLNILEIQEAEEKIDSYFQKQ